MYIIWRHYATWVYQHICIIRDIWSKNMSCQMGVMLMLLYIEIQTVSYWAYKHYQCTFLKLNKHKNLVSCKSVILLIYRSGKMPSTWTCLDSLNKSFAVLIQLLFKSQSFKGKAIALALKSINCFCRWASKINSYVWPIFTLINTFAFQMLSLCNKKHFQTLWRGNVITITNKEFKRVYSEKWP